MILTILAPKTNSIHGQAKHLPKHRRPKALLSPPEGIPLGETSVIHHSISSLQGPVGGGVSMSATACPFVCCCFFFFFFVPFEGSVGGSALRCSSVLSRCRLGGLESPAAPDCTLKLNNRGCVLCGGIAKARVQN